MPYALRPVLLLSLATGVLAGCAAESEPAVRLGDDKKSVQVVTYMPVGELADPEHGVHTHFSYGAVTAAGALPVNGVASLLVFKDKTSVVGLQVNVALPAEGTFYEVWVHRPKDPPSAWISLGHLQSAVGDVRHALKSEVEQDLTNYAAIAITLESDDGNPAPSQTAIALATLKTAKR